MWRLVVVGVFQQYQSGAGLRIIGTMSNIMEYMKFLLAQNPLQTPPSPEASGFDWGGQLPDGELTPAAANIRRELEERFLAALSQLEEDDRDILFMRHYEHLGNGEVATALNITPAAAGMRHLRALKKLRAILGESQG